MDDVRDLVTRGVANVIPDKTALMVLLSSGKKLNIYLGIDPTATHIHLGHAVPLRKLQRFAEMGHHVTFLIGDFTALIGDTSDKDAERPILTKEQIVNNFATYRQQAEKLVDFSRVTVRHNSQWLSKLTFEEIVKLCQRFSAGDFISRELIRNRLDGGKRVGLHELLYPAMQGYDSYYLDTDIQLGGTDQTFNMQAGRTLQKDLRQKESYIIANSFLTGTDGRKMSKSYGNAIWLDDPPNEMFGKVMSIRDELISEYFSLATKVDLTTIEDIESNLKAGQNPLSFKKQLAHTIVTELYGKTAADAAQQNFVHTFQKKNLSRAQIPTLPLKNIVPDSAVTQILVATGLVESKSAAKRLIQAGAVEINGEVLTHDGVAKLKAGDTIQAGKKRFLKIV